MKKATITIYKAEMELLRSGIAKRYEQLRGRNTSPFPIPNSNRVNYETVAQVIQKELNLPAPFPTSTLCNLFYKTKENEMTLKAENLDDLYWFFSGWDRSTFEQRGSPNLYEYVLFQGTEMLLPDGKNAELIVEREIMRTLRVKVGEIYQIRNDAQSLIPLHSFEIVDFQQLPTAYTGKITYEIQCLTPQINEWCIKFDPPLQAGEVVSYLIKTRQRGGYFFTLEEFEKAKKEKRLPAHFQAHSTNLKTRRAKNAKDNTLALVIHQDYPCEIKGAETSRVRYEPIEKLALEHSINENGHHIFKPKFSPKDVGNNYSIFWLPPSAKKLLEKGVITQAQYEKILATCLPS